uniref:Uncharacterized protein n=1 Tax=Helianthus annuus TaxID=4232 RepID=A0A251U883_HELAN
MVGAGIEAGTEAAKISLCKRTILNCLYVVIDGFEHLQLTRMKLGRDPAGKTTISTLTR